MNNETQTGEMASYTQQIIDGLHKILCDGVGRKGDGPWTTAILETLRAIGRGNGYQGYGDGGDTNSRKSAWLFDHVWVEYDKDRNIVDFPLVAESELNTEKSKHERLQGEDFDKLLLANAPYRLFVCQLDQENHAGKDMEEVEKNLIDRCTQRLKAYRRANMGDVFLIVVMRYRASPKYLKYRELVCGQAGWGATDGERPCP